MTYDSWLKAEDIPTIRRLDYIVENTDGFESGKLYAALRKVDLASYADKELDDTYKKVKFDRFKEILIPKMEWINQWMKAHNKEVIFTDINSWKAVGEDYAYFWMLTTEKDFAKEEAEARLGISGRKPVPAIYLEEYEEQICEMMETLKSEL